VVSETGNARRRTMDVTRWLRTRWELLAAGAILAAILAAALVATGRSSDQPPAVDIIEIPDDTVPTGMFPTTPPPVVPS
jgi:hypothetical protein